MFDATLSGNHVVWRTAIHKVMLRVRGMASCSEQAAGRCGWVSPPYVTALSLRVAGK